MSLNQRRAADNSPPTGAGDDAWPLLRTEEALMHDLAAVRVLGVEYVLWRDDAGNVNVWEDRCPHRGVRLNIGTNAGSELVCRYHGWRFASESGRCTFIPAHPNQAPPTAARATTLRCTEKYGLIWLLAGEGATPPAVPVLDERGATTMRSFTFFAPADKVRATLSAAFDTSAVVFFALPEDAGVTTVHAAAPGIFLGEERLALLVGHNRALKVLREEVERRTDKSSAEEEPSCLSYLTTS